MSRRTLNSLTLSLTTCLCVGYAADNAATDYLIRVMPAAWLADYSGQTNYSANGMSSSKQSFSDLGLANQEVGFGLEAGVKLPILVSLHAGGFLQETDGSFSGLNANYGGVNFTNGTSTAKFSDFYVEADVRPLDLDLVGVAIGLGYHLMSNQVTLSGNGQSAALDENYQFPVIALRAHANLPALISLGVEAKIHWMEITYLDNKIDYLDASLQVTWLPWENLGFIGGYRLLNSDTTFKKPSGTNASGQVDLTLGGPFLGLMGKF
jgi:hypothetical protein